MQDYTINYQYRLPTEYQKTYAAQRLRSKWNQILEPSKIGFASLLVDKKKKEPSDRILTLIAKKQTIFP
jgi:hypothetical protein